MHLFSHFYLKDLLSKLIYCFFVYICIFSSFLFTLFYARLEILDFALVFSPPKKKKRAFRFSSLLLSHPLTLEAPLNVESRLSR